MTSGLALGVGVGYQVVGFGGQVLYYEALGSGFWVVPYVGSGVIGTNGKFRGGIAGGVMGAWGRAHRIVLDMSAGVGAAQTRTSPLTGNVIDVRTRYGVSVALGYEYVADGGFWVRPTAGVTYLVDDPGANNSRWLPALNVTLGYKIW